MGGPHELLESGLSLLFSPAEYLLRSPFAHGFREVSFTAPPVSSTRLWDGEDTVSRLSSMSFRVALALRRRGVEESRQPTRPQSQWRDAHDMTRRSDRFTSHSLPECGTLAGVRRCKGQARSPGFWAVVIVVHLTVVPCFNYCFPDGAPRRGSWVPVIQ